MVVVCCWRQVATQLQIVIAAEDPFPLPKVHAAVYEMDGLPLDAAQCLLHMLIQRVHGCLHAFQQRLLAALPLQPPNDQATRMPSCRGLGLAGRVLARAVLQDVAAACNGSPLLLAAVWVSPGPLSAASRRPACDPGRCRRAPSRC